MRNLHITVKYFIVLFSVFLIVLPLHAQDYPEEDDDFFDDDALFMEDEGITITGTIETTQQIKIIGRDEIEQSHAAGLPGLLEETAGLGITGYGPYGSGTDVNIRGFDTERIAVLIDGVPANSVRSGGFDFNSIDINSIERIEVIYGGSDTKYNVSGAMGGVINIITVKKNEPGWRVGGSLSNTSALPGRYNKQFGGIADPQWQDLVDTQKLGLFGSYSAEKYSLSASLFGNRAGNHFLYKDDYGYARRKEGNEVYDSGASLSFVRDLPDFSKFIASGNVYYGDMNIPASGYTSEYAKQKNFSTHQNLMLEMPEIFRDDLAMDISLGYQWNDLDYDPGLDPSRHDEHVITLINRWSWYPLSDLTLRFGGDYRFMYIDSTNDGVHNGNNGGAYLGAEYSLFKTFLFISSIKGVTNGKQAVPVPKIGFAWKVTDSFTLKNNYFRSFKIPDFDDLYWVQTGFMGNPDLKPEDGWGADLTGEFHFQKWLDLNSTVYGEWTEDSIHWSNASGSWHPENIGTAAFMGWDTTIKLTLLRSPLFIERPSLSFSYQFQSSWLLTGGLDFDDEKRIPYMPMHKFGLSLELPWAGGAQGAGESVKKGGSLVMSGHYEGLRYADTGNIIELDPYFTLNMTVNQKINKNLTAFASLRNLLNASYVSFADYPMPGITLTIGMRMNFDRSGSNADKEAR
jgi:vitamin B12 transporter